uniref:Metallo-beta-lactamase domain-containing protein n=1 Tax=Ditylum brightwellii TaxID=49249 RepID=A0A7S4SSL0_9STRA|mmetsp:Transcript_14334/g.19164  ORF Transcript_14334/g.19164 Transcript_14334/m.19164 type:complete len:308 (+) Transcript_14334:1-924(+)
MDVPMAPEWDLGRFKGGRYYYKLYKEGRKDEPWGIKGLAGEDPQSWISRAPLMHLDPSEKFGEVEGGRDIFPLYDHPSCVDGAPIWDIEDEGDVRVYAAPMSHGVPCVGYVVEEQSRPGRLRNELVQPIVRRNLKGLKENGFRVPMKVMAVIKNLPEGGSFTFPDGTVLTQSEAVEPERSGRKVVICGDTADARAIAGLAEGADVLIHEATNTYLKGIDKDTNLGTVTKDAKVHGHSTPQIAGEFAARINAKRLILNHFSARYKGDQTLDSISIMTRIEQLAMKASQLEEDSVAAAWDFMILPLPQN